MKAFKYDSFFINIFKNKHLYLLTGDKGKMMIIVLINQQNIKSPTISYEVIWLSISLKYKDAPQLRTICLFHSTSYHCTLLKLSPILQCPAYGALWGR